MAEYPLKMREATSASSAASASTAASSASSATRLQVRLVDLPPDLLLCVLSHCDARTLVVGAARANRALRDVAVSDDAWRELMRRDYATLIARIFGGVCPGPSVASRPWRAHYFAFRLSWMTYTRAATGRIIMAIDDVVYDATGYMDDHPGSPELLLAAAGHDASDAFATLHSPNARRILQGFALARLDELVPPGPGGSGDRDGGAADGSSSPSSSVSTTWRSVLAELRSGEGRSRLGTVLPSIARATLSALFHDLTEGRPDCRRVSPAILRLAGAKLRSLSVM